MPDHVIEVVARFTRAVREAPQVDQRSGVSRLRTPETGNQPSRMLKNMISTMPSQKAGTAAPSSVPATIA